MIIQSILEIITNRLSIYTRLPLYKIKINVITNKLQNILDTLLDRRV